MIIKGHFQLSDEDFERQFKRFSFKPLLFTHEAHLRLAFIHIQKYGLQKAEVNLIKQIKEYAEYYGANEKFNKTITIASIRTINKFMKSSLASDFQELTSEFPQLLADFRSIIAKHYSFNVFADKQAKKEFVPPDLLPF